MFSKLINMDSHVQFFILQRAYRITRLHGISVESCHHCLPYSPCWSSLALTLVCRVYTLELMFFRRLKRFLWSTAWDLTPLVVIFSTSCVYPHVLCIVCCQRYENYENAIIKRRRGHPSEHRRCSGPVCTKSLLIIIIIVIQSFIRCRLSTSKAESVQALFTSMCMSIYLLPVVFRFRFCTCIDVRLTRLININYLFMTRLDHVKSTSAAGGGETSVYTVSAVSYSQISCTCNTILQELIAWEQVISGMSFSHRQRR